MRRRDFMVGGLIGGAAAAWSTEAGAVQVDNQVRLVRMRFKPDGKRRWLDWATELKRRRAEVIETLRNEGVRSEACFLTKDGESVYYFMEAADFDKVMAAFAASKLPIDAEHQQALRASLEVVEELDLLFSFQNDASSPR